MDRESLALLQRLTMARGPCGQEDEVRSLCSELLTPLCDEVRVDLAGNLIGFVKGRDQQASPIRVMTHMDEIALIVKRINEDGTVRVDALGGIFPYNFGQGMVEILGDEGIVNGVLSQGSIHTTKETEGVHLSKPRDYRGKGETAGWEDVYVITRQSAEQLKQAGIHPGTRVVIAQSRRHLHRIEDCIGGYFMDNRAAIAVGLLALQRLREGKERPRSDLYFVLTTEEEIGASGAKYAAQTLPGAIDIAVDVGPVAKEYQTILNAQPIIVYRDAYATYTKSICDRLVVLGEELGLEPQRAVFASYGSDASITKQNGSGARAGLITIPTENTHGFEVIHQDALKNCAELLALFVQE